MKSSTILGLSIPMAIFSLFSCAVAERSAPTATIEQRYSSACSRLDELSGIPDSGPDYGLDQMIFYSWYCDDNPSYGWGYCFGDLSPTTGIQRATEECKVEALPLLECLGREDGWTECAELDVPAECLGHGHGTKLDPPDPGDSDCAGGLISDERNSAVLDTSHIECSDGEEYRYRCTAPRGCVTQCSCYVSDELVCEVEFSLIEGSFDKMMWELCEFPPEMWISPGDNDAHCEVRDSSETE